MEPDEYEATIAAQDPGYAPSSPLETTAYALGVDPLYLLQAYVRGAPLVNLVISMDDWAVWIAANPF